jgi:hypothetical protein
MVNGIFGSARSIDEYARIVGCADSAQRLDYGASAVHPERAFGLDFQALHPGDHWTGSCRTEMAGTAMLV